MISFFTSKRKSVKTLQISVLAFLATWLLHGIGGLEPLRRWAFSAASALREVRVFGGADTVPSPDIIIVAIDEASVRALGVSPWRRCDYGKLLRQVAQDAPAAIGFNVLLPEHDPAGPANDLDLAAQITKAQRVVLPCLVVLANAPEVSRSGLGSDVYPMPDFQRGAAGLGFTNVGADAAHINIVLAGRDSRNNSILSFPLAVYEVYAQQRVVLSSWAARVGDLHIPLEGHGLLWVDYPRKRPTTNGLHIPAIEVLNGNYPRGLFTGKIVLIGRTDRPSGDFITTPLGQIPTTDLFAYVLNTILRKSFFHSIGFLADTMVLLALVFLTVFVTLRYRILVSLLIVAEEIVGIGLMAAVLFGRHHAIMNFPVMFMGILLSFAFTQIYTLFIRERELTTLGIYMSSEVRRKILDSAQPFSVRGERKVVTVLFADIRGFTRFSHRLDPSATVALLNSYFTGMVEVITRPGHDGTIDKLVGDGIVAVFGDPLPFPDHGKRAILAAVAMQKRFSEIKRSWAPHIKKLAPKYDMNKMQLGIGVATGEVVVGNVGAPAHGFMSYTVIGDPANRAAGLQDIAAGGQILFDGDTQKQLDNAIHAKDLGEHTVKGLRMHMFQIGP